MSTPNKSIKQILEKLKIEQLNPMQIESKNAILNNDEVVILSPTGTGKTLAFLLPIVELLDPNCTEIQAVIIAPSRELVLQIEQVTREMGSGYKANAFYGGRYFSRDRIDLNNRPAILIGTPGRVADHLRRNTFSTEYIKTLILDEFDKSLEVGFEGEMTDICGALSEVEKTILTSATQGVSIPIFVGLQKPIKINYLKERISTLKIKRILSPEKDKLETLVVALCHLGKKRGIIFCNYKDSINRVSSFLTEKNIEHGCFYGGMEQKDRERVLIKFRNGTHRILLATDLAARGLDVQELDYILHYHLPLREEEFTHRNGRTARMHNEGVAYVLHWDQDELPSFIPYEDVEEINEATTPEQTEWATLYISGGRKDKISKGDIAGLFMKQGNLNKDELGIIELKIDCAFVAVKKSKAKSLIKELDSPKLKKKKVRIQII